MNNYELNNNNYMYESSYEHVKTNYEDTIEWNDYFELVDKLVDEFDKAYHSLDVSTMKECLTSLENIGEYFIADRLSTMLPRKAYMY